MALLTARVRPLRTGSILVLPFLLIHSPTSSQTLADSAAAAPRASLEGTAAATPPESEWWREARRQAGEAEYRPSRAQHTLQAPNRANGFRTRFTERGISIEERRSPDPAVLVEISLQSIGDGATARLVPPGTVEQTPAQIEIRRPDVVEWYKNSAAGLEQGFTLFERPGRTGTVELDLGIRHAAAKLSGDSVLLTSAAGPELRYGKLVAQDATGRVLPSRIEVPSPTMLRLAFDDTAAVYPVVVDPLINGVADRIVASDRTSTLLDPTAFGRSVEAAGDVNGDGFDDLIVGAPGWDGGFFDEGAAFVFLGSAAGIVGSGPAGANAVIQSRQASANFGTAVAGAGDVNNDGYDDIMVGSPVYASTIENGTLLVEGAVFVFLGGPGGITAADTTTANAWIQNDALRNSRNSPSGIREPWSQLSTAGDVNRDGYDDILIGLQDYGARFVEPNIPSNQRQGSAGQALVYHGGPNGINSNGTPGFATANAIIKRPPVGAAREEGNVGASVSEAGDVNGDGFDDIVVGSSGGSGNPESPDDMLSVFLGSPAGVVGRDPDFAHAVIRGDTPTPLGSAVSQAGDVNGDGYGDIVAGSYPANSGDPTSVQEGAVLVFLGGPAGVTATSPAGAQATFRGSLPAELLGNGVGSADVDHDGFDDIIATARIFPGSLDHEGVAYVFRGSPAGIIGEDLDDAYVRLGSGQSGAAFEGGNYAFSAAGLGDVNGDGFEDVAAGFGFYDDGQVDEGAVLVFHGGPTGANNQAPVAVPGPNQTVVDTDNDDTETVTLDGRGSFDPDGTIVAYRWLEGETVLGTSAVVTASLGIGLHTLTLTVTDNGGRTSGAAMTVLVNPVQSIQAAGDPFESGNFVGGFGSWVGGWVTTGNAAIVQGGAFSLPYQARVGAGAASMRRTVTLPSGATGIELRLWGKALSFAGADEVEVSVSADGGPSVLLERVTSAAPNNSWQFRSLNHSWFPATAASATITFEASTSAGQFFIDSIIVRALAAPLANQPPVANAGLDQNDTDVDDDGVETVILLGAGSTDPDGTITSYQWTEGATPLGTQVNQPVELAIGEHTITLTVRDNTGLTDTDTVTVTVHPRVRTLSAIALEPTSVVGGSSATAIVTLSDVAPSGGTAVSVSDNSSATLVPASITVPAGFATASFTVTTTPVASTTISTISASAGGSTHSAALSVTAAPGTGGTPGRPTLLSPSNDSRPSQPVTLDWTDVANAASYEVQVDTSSSFTTPLTANPTVTESRVTLSDLPAQRLYWRVRARNSAGTPGSFSSSRRFTPRAMSGPATLSALTINPAGVSGGSSATGTVTLSGAAPSGGAAVTLSSSNAAVAVPGSVTVASGQTSATFSASTSTVTSATAATITAAYSGATRTASLAVNPPGAGATLTVRAIGRSGSRITSSPAGINVTVGSTASASFASGTSITLTVSDGREAVFTGACSTNGNERRSCTFTISGNASVTADVD